MPRGQASPRTVVVAGPPGELPSWERVLLCSPSPEDEGMELGILKGEGRGGVERGSLYSVPPHLPPQIRRPSAFFRPNTQHLATPQR